MQCTRRRRCADAAAAAFDGAPCKPHPHRRHATALCVFVALSLLATATVVYAISEAHPGLLDQALGLMDRVKAYIATIADAGEVVTARLQLLASALTSAAPAANAVPGGANMGASLAGAASTVSSAAASIASAAASVRSTVASLASVRGRTLALGGVARAWFLGIVYTGLSLLGLALVGGALAAVSALPAGVVAALIGGLLLALLACLLAAALMTIAAVGVDACTHAEPLVLALAQNVGGAWAVPATAYVAYGPDAAGSLAGLPRPWDLLGDGLGLELNGALAQATSSHQAAMGAAAQLASAEVDASVATVRARLNDVAAAVAILEAKFAFPPLHALYLDAKATACCAGVDGAGGLWLSLGVVVVGTTLAAAAAVAVLARLDRLSPRGRHGCARVSVWEEGGGRGPAGGVLGAGASAVAPSALPQLSALDSAPAPAWLPRPVGAPTPPLPMLPVRAKKGANALPRTSSAPACGWRLSALRRLRSLRQQHLCGGPGESTSVMPAPPPPPATAPTKPATSTSSTSSASSDAGLLKLETAVSLGPPPPLQPARTDPFSRISHRSTSMSAATGPPLLESAVSLAPPSPSPRPARALSADAVLPAPLPPGDE